MMLLLQVLLEKRFVGVPLSSAMFTIISFPVWFFCMSSANQNKPFSWNLPELSIRGAGQEDRSSGYENAVLVAKTDSEQVLWSAYNTKFFVSSFGRAFKVMKNGVYLIVIIVIAFLFAELFKILVYANHFKSSFE